MARLVRCLPRSMRNGISIGLDIVDVREVERSVAQFGERYLVRVFTPSEVAYATSARDTSTVARRLAARFAAKEATLKALGAVECGISPRSIEVVRRNDGAIELELHGPAFAAARAVGAMHLALTMSHEQHIAAAVVVARAGGPTRSRIWWRP